MQTSRGARVIIYNGYKFFRQRVSAYKERWYCSHHVRGCKAVIFTIENDILSVKEQHNHEPPKSLRLMY